MNDADAELLTFAQRGAGEVGAWTMTLRQTTNEEAETTEGVVLADLFERYGVVVPTEFEDLATPPEEAP